MKHYWSCWFTKDELIQHGATDLYPAMYWLSGILIPTKDTNDRDYRDWCFIASDEFALFLKLTKDKSIAEISPQSFNAGLTGNNTKIDENSQDGKRLRACSLDF